MAGTHRLFLDATYAIALMAFVGILSGFATAAMTGDTERSLQVAIAMFAVTGALLSLRSNHTHRLFASPHDEGDAFVMMRGEDGASAVWTGHRRRPHAFNGRAKSLDAPGGVTGRARDRHPHLVRHRTSPTRRV